MNDEYTRCCELLGVGPGADAQELKAAYRDMAKVWHPDRFAHDPRLQQKAQEKLKEINEAYEFLTDGGRSRRTAARADYDRSAAAERRTARRPLRWQSILLPVLLFGAVFAAARALIPSLTKDSTPPAATSSQSQTDADPEAQQQQQGAGANSTTAAKKRTAEQTTREVKPYGAADAETDARSVTPMPTVTVTIDPSTGMLAAANCPTRTRMTYPAGREPGQYCNAQHQQEAPATEAEPQRPKQSRLKSLAKRLGIGKQ